MAEGFHKSHPECRISGTVRSQERKTQYHNHPWLNVHVLDLDESYVGLDEHGLSDLVSATHVIQTVAPLADFDRDPILAFHEDDLRRSARLRWVGYISSTGVYGDHGGEWIDEDSELRCVDRKSLARVRAEEEWQALEKEETLGKNGDGDIDDDDYQKPRIDCFRCGGIYGPGRSMITSVLREQGNERSTTSAGGRMSATPKYVNRILVDDICSALLTAASSDDDSKDGRRSGKIFNLVDDDPAPRNEVGAEARRLLGLSSADDGNNEVNNKAAAAGRKVRATSRNTGNKRCKNQRLKSEYGWELSAPTFREGLMKLLDVESR
mmetsp:Transcript_32327/g.47135  ORF Transcript_32327/g.47135 Transcript_32327/m.47135 type:complete len:323 (+) Transcript_32327:2-970(+)